ncbi:MAG: glycosyltransferase [Chthoniobacteraceae bacterium]|nr:glycosyltransferase [Chthoniobacteraceae bacterium]
MTSLNLPPSVTGSGHEPAPKQHSEGPRKGYSILVHSHLRWDWVWQRPQQFLSRLAQRHPILFVEEPVCVEGLAKPRAKIRGAEGLPNLTILTAEFPESLMAERETRDEAHYHLVRETLTGALGRTFVRPLQWFYNPMAVVPFAGKMNERAIVYDCMDQLSQFRGAPPELIHREHKLLSVADVVFAGGPKIHKAKRLLNPNCHCYGCGVDVKHFGQAILPTTAVPNELAVLPKPRLGYFGAVDERMDYKLIAALADAHPEWSVIIIGPWTKVDPATFPRRTNLHWLGSRDYQQLPSYVKGLNVCLMPFAINKATEFINPTKALEYMAAERPIVSTAIEDVVLQFFDVVRVAQNRKEFIRGCEEAVRRPDRHRIRRGRELAIRNSWEAIVAQLERHLEDALEVRRQFEIFAG